jgi:hypothetical protein
VSIPDSLMKLIHSLNGMEHAFLKVESIEEKAPGEFVIETKTHARATVHIPVFYELRFDAELSLLCLGYASHPYIKEGSVAAAEQVLETYDDPDEYLYIIIDEDPCIMLAVCAWEVDENGRIDCADDPRKEILKTLAKLPQAWNQAFDFMCAGAGFSITGVKTFLH